MINSNVAVTSKESLASTQVKPQKLSQLHQDVLDIVRIAQRNGAIDMTTAEIQQVYEERVTNRRIKDGPFARTLFEMVTAGWLLRSPVKRQSRTGGGNGPAVYAHYVPAAQATSTPLFY